MIDPQPPADEAETEAPAPPKVPWTFLDAVLVALIFVFAFGFGGALLLAGLESQLDNLHPVAVRLIVSQGVLLITATVYVQVRYGAVAALFGARSPGLRDIGIGIGAGVVAYLVLAGAVAPLVQLVADALDSGVPPVQEDFRDMAGDRTGAPLLVFGAGLLGPIAEETFYRGLLFAGLRRRFRRWTAIALTGALFGVSHAESTLDGSLFVFAVIVPLGMFLAWLYERREALIVPILAHATFNLAQLFFLIRAGEQL